MTNFKLKPYFLFLILTLVFAGCNPSNLGEEKKQMVYDYLSIDWGSRFKYKSIDKDLEIKNLKEIQQIFASDSIDLISSNIEIMKSTQIKRCQNEIDFHTKNLQRIQQYGETWEGEEKYTTDYITQFQNKIETLNTPPYTGTNLEKRYAQLSHFKKDPSKLLSTKYACNYSLNLSLKVNRQNYFFSNPKNNQFIHHEKILEAKWCKSCAVKMMALPDIYPFTCFECKKDFK